MKRIHEDPIYGGDMLEEMRDSAEVQEMLETAERLASLGYNEERVRFEAHEIYGRTPMGDIQSALAEMLLDAFILGMIAGRQYEA